MKVQIKHRLDFSILFELECESFKICVEKSIEQKIDLSYADLSYANLSYANLVYANLGSADLSYADLSYANLSSANLRYANLRYANLGSADLGSANLSYANLVYANLGSADLSYANLSYANLVYANLMTFQFQRDIAYFTFDGALRIGCLIMPITEWIIGYEEIGKANDYNETQIEMYGDFIKQCAKLFESQNKK